MGTCAIASVAALKSTSKPDVHQTKTERVLQKVVEAAHAFVANEASARCPTIARLVEAGYLPRAPRDRWKQRIVVDCAADCRVVRSAGPDRLFDSADDLLMTLEQNTSSPQDRSR
jgi:exosome complex RNA-binding protein Rrp42 (RNase PH superfamily)